MKKTTMGCLLLLLSTAAFGDEGAAASKIRQLDALAGTWRCSGTAFASPEAPQHATSGEATLKWDLDGHWLPFTYAEKKTAENPMPYRATGFFGYDPEIGQLVNGGVDNMGGYSTAASDGWNGDSIVFTGPWHMGPQTLTSRDTFTRKGEQLMHMLEMQQDGKWVKLAEESCTKK
jgi:hypothetical protein